MCPEADLLLYRLPDGRLNCWGGQNSTGRAEGSTTNPNRLNNNVVFPAGFNAPCKVRTRSPDRSGFPAGLHQDPVLLTEIPGCRRHDRPFSDDDFASLPDGLAYVVFAYEFGRLLDRSGFRGLHARRGGSPWCR